MRRLAIIKTFTWNFAKHPAVASAAIRETTEHIVTKPSSGFISTLPLLGQDVSKTNQSFTETCGTGIEKTEMWMAILSVIALIWPNASRPV
jgi:hypothetical protein